ncbi:MAG: endonuclease/exonuclease/phosphatase family protein [Janthinobacterium lividum]
MRVMTYNIRGGLGMDGRRSTERIAEVILAQDADIVCLQEVHQRLPQSAFVDQPKQLEKFLGQTVTFQANLRLGIGGYGLAVISRYPVGTVQNHLLPSVREQRGVLEVRLDTQNGPVIVFCTHFGLNGEERVKQAARLAELVEGAAYPVIVCGDFNERPDAAGIQTLLAQTGLNDADANQNRLTYPTNALEARIDYVFSSPVLTPGQVSVIAADASDHLPIVAEFLVGE